MVSCPGRSSTTRFPTRTRKPCCGCARAACARCGASSGASSSTTFASAISGWPKSSWRTSGRASSDRRGSRRKGPTIRSTRIRALPPRAARVRQARRRPSMRRITAIGCLALAFGARAADPDIKFEKYQLQNALTVILSEDHRLPQVAVDIWYHVGAANQTPGKSGFAHLFEHMMFSGSKHVQPSPFQVLESIGASGVNGTTSFDRTNYFEVVPSSQLAAALWIESDRMGFLLDTLDEKKLRVQRDVVSNEKRQNYDNRPYGSSGLRLCDLFFPKPHPYYECVIGDIADIQAASVQDLRQFFTTWYGPQNASLAIVGDFDPKVARELVEKYFGPIPGGTAVAPADVPQPAIGRVVQETLEDKLAEVPRLVLAWKGVRQYTEEEPAGDVLSDVLGTGKTSRLYKRLVFEKQLASGVSASDATAGLAGGFQITVTAARGHTLDEIRPPVLESLGP